MCRKKAERKGLRPCLHCTTGRVSAQLEAIAALPVYRHAELLPMAEESVSTWMGAVTAGVQKLHARHALTDARSGVAYSFGLVRVANIATAWTWPGIWRKNCHRRVLLAIMRTTGTSPASTRKRGWIFCFHVRKATGISC